MAQSSDDEIAAVERSVRAVYEFRPPTLVHYKQEGRAQYEFQWQAFMKTLGLPPDFFRGRTLLDVGCGSCEKASFYHDWGAKVTGLDMTRSVLDHARKVVGQRDIRLVAGSLFETLQSEAFDIVVADGVLHHTADTFAALRVCTERLAPGGTLVFGLVNVWGTFWWFRWARILTSVMGGSDFHKRARWGQRLFTTVRKSQEGTKRSSFFFRSAHSWAYDWFGNPRWNLHSPAEVRQWMRKLRLTHRQSLPSIMKKQNSRNAVARLISFITGPGPAFMSLFWLVNREPNMFYVVVTRPTSKDG